MQSTMVYYRTDDTLANRMFHALYILDSAIMHVVHDGDAYRLLSELHYDLAREYDKVAR